MKRKEVKKTNEENMNIDLALIVTGVCWFLFVLFTSAPANSAELPGLFEKPNYYAIGAQVGKCEAAGNISMCNDREWVWHLYADANFPLTESGQLLWTVSAEHYSAWDGEDDINGNTEGQSGVFNYVGTGFELRF